MKTHAARDGRRNGWVPRPSLAGEPRGHATAVDVALGAEVQVNGRAGRQRDVPHACLGSRVAILVAGEEEINGPRQPGEAAKCEEAIWTVQMAPPPLGREGHDLQRPTARRAHQYLARAVEPAAAERAVRAHPRAACDGEMPTEAVTVKVVVARRADAAVRHRTQANRAVLVAPRHVNDGAVGRRALLGPALRRIVVSVHTPRRAQHRHA